MIGNRWLHWICRNCEVMNHNSRIYCLSCGEPIKNVVITDKKELDEIYFRINGRYVRSNKRFKP